MTPSGADGVRLYPPMRENAAAAPGFLGTVGKGASGRGAGAEFAAEPGPGVDPLPVGAAGRNPEDGSRMVAGHPAEVAQFDESGLDRVVPGQADEHHVEGQQVEVRLRGGEGVEVHGVPLPAAAVLAG